MRTPTLLRRKSVKEAIQKFVERVSQIPQVQAVLLVQSEEGFELQVVVDQPDLIVVDAVAELEGDLIDQMGMLPFLSDVIFRQGQPLESFVSPQTLILWQR